jgi:hypothetical protein
MNTAFIKLMATRHKLYSEETMANEHNDKHKKAIAYRKMIGAMAKVRWNVDNKRHKRPDGAIDVGILMSRFREYALVDQDVDYDAQLKAICDFVGLSVDELHYFADVAEWIDAERDTAELDGEEYDSWWENDADIPSMNLLHRMKWMNRSPEERDEISSLDALFYKS